MITAARCGDPVLRVFLKNYRKHHAARIITFSNYDRSTDELLRMVNWVKLDRQRHVDKSLMMNKVELVSSVVNDKFNQRRPMAKLVDK